MLGGSQYTGTEVDEFDGIGVSCTVRLPTEPIESVLFLRNNAASSLKLSSGFLPIAIPSSVNAAAVSSFSKSISARIPVLEGEVVTPMLSNIF